jgi:hypothetical protein
MDRQATADAATCFHEQGYLVGEALFSNEEIAAFAGAYSTCLDSLTNEGTLASIRDGELDDGTPTQVYQIRAAHLQHPLFADLIRDPRIMIPWSVSSVRISR